MNSAMLVSEKMKRPSLYLRNSSPLSASSRYRVAEHSVVSPSTPAKTRIAVFIAEMSRLSTTSSTTCHLVGYSVIPICADKTSAVATMIAGTAHISKK